MEDIIPGWPDLKLEDVKLFQLNNKLTPDGIIGPKTRAKIWRKSGTATYTFLAGHRVKRGGAQESADYLEYRLRSLVTSGSRFGISSDNMQLVCGLLCSDWKTGFNFLSTQDGITLGGRRLAASTLREFIDVNRDGFQQYLGVYDLFRVIDKLKDAPNNGWPLNEPSLRAGFIAACEDRVLWDRQIQDMTQHVMDILGKVLWTKGRTIALACRMANSSPKLIRNLPKREDEAYAEMRRRYWERSRTGQRRVLRIEELIPDGKVWR